MDHLISHEIDWFHQYLIDNPGCIDIKIPYPGHPLLASELIDNPEVDSRFTGIAANKSGSLICLWHESSPQKTITSLPIVWLDSEWSPNAVFANSPVEFLSIMPYGLNLIYDIIYKSELFFKDKNKYPDPKLKFFGDAITKHIELRKEKFGDSYLTLIKRMESDLGIKLAPNPAEIIVNAYPQTPNLQKLLDSL